jgi:hypothetical protein
LPAGALLGGFLGDSIGLHATLVVSAFGAWLVVLAVMRSPLRAAREPSAALAGAA